MDFGGDTIQSITLPTLPTLVFVPKYPDTDEGKTYNHANQSHFKTSSEPWLMWLSGLSASV